MTTYGKIETLYERDEATHRLKQPPAYSNTARKKSRFKPYADYTPEQKAARAAYYKKWAAQNRDKINESVRVYRARRYAKEGRWRDEGPKAVALKAWFLELKSGPCSDCGGRFPSCCMDFDHLQGEHKSYCVGTMVAHHYSRQLIELEVAKCNLVCANCHRIRTRDRRVGTGISLVGRPIEALFDKKGHRLIVKLKTKDF